MTRESEQARVNGPEYRATARWLKAQTRQRAITLLFQVFEAHGVTATMARLNAALDAELAARSSGAGRSGACRD
ncbi:MAG: hypothetical protein U0232_03640 [Thermomicrobiales bacterium]